jgi:hypothetical protein
LEKGEPAGALDWSIAIHPPQEINDPEATPAQQSKIKLAISGSSIKGESKR